VEEIDTRHAIEMAALNDELRGLCRKMNHDNAISLTCARNLLMCREELEQAKSVLEEVRSANEDLDRENIRLRNSCNKRSQTEVAPENNLGWSLEDDVAPLPGELYARGHMPHDSWFYKQSKVNYLAEGQSASCKHSHTGI